LDGDKYDPHHQPKWDAQDGLKKSSITGFFTAYGAGAIKRTSSQDNNPGSNKVDSNGRKSGSGDNSFHVPHSPGFKKEIE
jgi:hypothetical protein